MAHVFSLTKLKQRTAEISRITFPATIHLLSRLLILDDHSGRLYAR
jgi:hypothetical protein